MDQDFKDLFPPELAGWANRHPFLYRMVSPVVFVLVVIALALTLVYQGAKILWRFFGLDFLWSGIRSKIPKIRKDKKQDVPFRKYDGMKKPKRKGEE